MQYIHEVPDNTASYTADELATHVSLYVTPLGGIVYEGEDVVPSYVYDVGHDVTNIGITTGNFLCFATFSITSGFQQGFEWRFRWPL